MSSSSAFLCSFRLLFVVSFSSSYTRYSLLVSLFFSSLFLVFVPLIVSSSVFFVLHFTRRPASGRRGCSFCFVLVDFSIQLLFCPRYRRSSNCCASGRILAIVLNRVAKARASGVRVRFSSSVVILGLEELRLMPLT